MYVAHSNIYLNFNSRKTKSLPDFELESSPKDARLVNAFIRGRTSDKTDPTNEQTLPLYNNDDPGGTQTMVRSKDTMNQVRSLIR